MNESSIRKCALVLLVVSGSMALAAEQQFVLRDYLNRPWQNELVTYSVTFPAPGGDPASLRLYGPDGKPVPVQIEPADRQKSARLTQALVSFKASIEPLGAATYRLAEGREPLPPTDLETGERQRMLRIASGASSLLKFITTGDQTLGKAIAAELWGDGKTSGFLPAYMSRFTTQKGLAHSGDAPHQDWKTIMPVTNRTDAILDSPLLTPQQKTLIRAQLAFAAYRHESADVLSPERGWSANPNVSCCFYAGLGQLACLLASHPHAKRWFQRSYEELRLDLDTWVGPRAALS